MFFLENFPRRNPLFLPKSRDKFSTLSWNPQNCFSRQQQISQFSTLYTFPTHHLLFITSKTAFHHCTFSFITAHFVHHCTLKHALSIAGQWVQETCFAVSEEFTPLGMVLTSKENFHLLHRTAPFFYLNIIMSSSVKTEKNEG